MGGTYRKAWLGDAHQIPSVPTKKFLHFARRFSKPGFAVIKSNRLAIYLYYGVLIIEEVTMFRLELGAPL